MNYGLVISNHTFDTLYAIVIRAKEGEKMSAPVYAIPHGGRVNIPKTLLDFDDHVLFFGIVDKMATLTSMATTAGIDPPQSSILGVTTYLKYSSFQAMKPGSVKEYVPGSKTPKPKLSSFLPPSTSTLIGSTIA
jgi:hypothetical protein